MKLLIAFSFQLFFNDGSSVNSYEDVRGKYFEALRNTDIALSLYEEDYENMQEKDALLLAYKGALEAILTKTTWNVFKKMSYLRQSNSTLNKATRLDPKNVEVRFLRIAVQCQIPSYLGYNENIEEDRRYILHHIEDFNFQELDPKIQYEIMKFFINCDKFNKQEIFQLKESTATR